VTGDDTYKNDVEALVRSFMPGGDVAQTPCGLAWRDKWGPNRHAGRSLSINEFKNAKKCKEMNLALKYI
jgi:hypothetical protein